MADLKLAVRRKQLSDAQLKELEELFFMDGISAYQAHKLTGINVATVKKYFGLWAEKLTNEDHYESWTEKQARVKARALEGITKQYVNVAQRLDHLEKLYKTVILKQVKRQGKKVAVPRKAEEIDMGAQNQLDFQIRKNIELLEGLRSEMLTLNLMPPAEVILDQEIEKEIAAKQQVTA